MTDATDLDRLLTGLKFDTRISAFVGLDVIRERLRDDDRLLAHLERAYPELEGDRRRGVAFALAERYRETGAVAALRALATDEDSGVVRSVLNALWFEPGADPAMATCIVELAHRGMADPNAGVRTEACSVIQNQSGWGVDVSSAADRLFELLDDEEFRVRQQATHAVGNLAKAKVDVTGALEALRANLGHDHPTVRDAAAWTLWQCSCAKHDISIVVPALTALLADEGDWSSPRKNAVGALLHHAKKSAENAQHVRAAAESIPLKPTTKEATRLIEWASAEPR